MPDLPHIQPQVLAAIAESVPARLRKKLDKNPAAAKDWDWSQSESRWTIDAGNEQVHLETVDNAITLAEQVSCSCLLSPRCFHVLSVLSVLELADASQIEPPIPDQDEDAEPEEIPEEFSAAQTEAALVMWNAAATILATGARAAGTLLQSHLLRAIHECRSQGLHRLQAAGLRVMQNIRLLREEHDAFRSEDLLNDFTELLKIAWTLSQPDANPTQEDLGVARRKYTPAGSLRLEGLLTEPILTRSGFSGVVTYLIAEDGTLGSVSNVRPGKSDRIQEAYQTGVELGGLSVPHRALNRQGLLVQKATRSPDGRLGNSKDCRAIAVESSGWQSEAITRRFQEPLSEQVQRVFQFDRLPITEQPAGWDLLFLLGSIVGSDGENLLLSLAENQGVMRLKIANDHPAIPFRENLAFLARVPGLDAQCVARMVLSSPRDALALAIGPSSVDEENAECDLPKDWQGRINLGFDKLDRRYFPSAERTPHLVEVSNPAAEVSDGLDFVRRRLQAVAVGGRHALPTGKVRATVSEARTLDGSLQPAAAVLLKGLAQCAIESQTDLLGIRFPPDPSWLAKRWLAGAIYEETARRQFQKWSWQQGES